MSSSRTVSAMKPVCNVCGADVDTVLISKDGYEILQCRDCRLAFTYPQPESLASQYDNSYFDLYRRRREFRLRRSRDRLKRIELIRHPGRLLDIGCSLGYFVESANKRGWSASGVEISPFAAEEARQMGLDVHTGILEQCDFSDSSFDCVTMWDVLEHVTDPVTHMAEVRRILKPGGLVAIGTPDIGHPLFRLKKQEWRHLKPAEHIFYFQRSSIRLLLQKTGFTEVTPTAGQSVLGHVSAGIRRVTQFNDVMIVYGAKNGV